MRASTGVLVTAFTLVLPARAQDTTPPPAAEKEHAAPAPIAEDAIVPLSHVERRGTGPIPMVLIPGLWCDWSIFDEFMTRNADRYTMYAVTFPGYAASEPPPVPADPKDFVAQQWRTNAVRALLKLIREEGLDKPVVVGHADAGRLAMRLATEHATMVGKVVSIDGHLAVPLGGPTGAPATIEERRLIVTHRMSAERVTQEFWEAQVRTNATTLVQNPGRAVLLGDTMASVPWPVARRYWIESIAEDLHPQIDALQSDLLVVVPVSDQFDAAGAEDHRARWRRSFEDVERARLVFVDDCRQFIMYDKPEKLDEVIGVFLGVMEAQPQEPGQEPEAPGTTTVGQ